jgi:hypothetical protein
VGLHSVEDEVSGAWLTARLGLNRAGGSVEIRVERTPPPSKDDFKTASTERLTGY